jgi:undecaprenyl-diphosphatase
MIEVLKAIILGIIEGITEWLPISSTGHMILVDEFLKLDVSDEFKELFLVVIQLGAILAVPVIFFEKLNPFSKGKSQDEKKNTWSLWSKVIVGIIPAGLVGVVLDDLIDEYFYNYIVVSIALIVYGIAFLLIERTKKARDNQYAIESVDAITYKDAIKIGLFQTLSLIPGTSRSGSTILGGMLVGVNRTASAEFSFFMAIPIMLGASLLKILKFAVSGITATSFEIWLLIVGILVSFAISLFAIKFLMDFVKRHSFSAFGIYRIALGVIVIIFFVIKSLI